MSSQFFPRIAIITIVKSAAYFTKEKQNTGLICIKGKELIRMTQRTSDPAVFSQRCL